MSSRHAAVAEFDRWVGANNIPERFEYGKGWWDYVELIRRFKCKFDLSGVRVIGDYKVSTPPPEEELPMPAVALIGRGVTVALKWDFGARCHWPREWTLSVRRRSRYVGPIFGLFDPAFDLRGEGVDGFPLEWVFGPYRENPAEFTCEVEDEWDVAALLRFVFYEA